MKKKTKHKTPSRARYDESHPVISGRLDRDTYDHLKVYLEESGCSLADFVKDALGREESMVEKRVETLASRQADPSLEERVRCLEDLIHEVFMLTVDTDEYPPLCPRCDNQELFQAEGRETESSLAHPVVFTWKCPGCGFFVDTYKRIDPKSIKWIDPDSGKYIDKPKALARHRLKKRKPG
jgi:hypothetical protein